MPSFRGMSNGRGYAGRDPGYAISRRPAFVLSRPPFQAMASGYFMPGIPEGRDVFSMISNASFLENPWLMRAL